MSKTTTTNKPVSRCKPEELLEHCLRLARAANRRKDPASKEEGLKQAQEYRDALTEKLDALFVGE